MSDTYYGGTYALSDQGSSQESAANFARLSQTVSSNIQKIQQNVSQIQRMVGQLGTSQETEMLWDKLGQIQHYTNHLAKDTSKNLKDLSSLGPSSSQSDQRIRKMQVERLTKDFSDALGSFQSTQRRVAERERESVARTRAQSSSKAGDFDNGTDHTLVSIPGPRAPQQMQAQIDDTDVELLQERENSIRQLENDIQDVNVIFKDLGMLVHEQGEIVDSIEANIEQGAIQVEEGTRQIRKAADYQTRSRKKCFCIVVILIVLGGVIGLIIWLSTR
ncbi:PREDICTED: syntaxin-7-like isoform X1 [Priapulus caudatus]|uniref:Syntaxin-7-like isoform X1 n=1 Tax=Priapulus caudatus TaxID=37621 RepID=A0ABM1EPR8_PRICU|nr:PREDICTED: syntaxin-7-like isoform X1 [Priapulus caudatus]XP_014674188.1 PREDICTED: syntaxin-7-like isoform X1 [Priapulus caudatus]XP_014674189.1 PREDICTED: syntaxin-7-like isoform X1 [Priapulus caudatus]